MPIGIVATIKGREYLVKSSIGEYFAPKNIITKYVAIPENIETKLKKKFIFLKLWSSIFSLFKKKTIIAINKRPMIVKEV